MGTDCKSAAFSFGGSNPPAPTKKTSVENTLVFCFIRYLKFHPQARLAISTRAHQEIQYPNRVLDFLFCRHFFRTGRDDRRLRRKQGGEAGPALRVPFYFAWLAKSLKNAQTNTTVRVDGGSVIEKRQVLP